MIKALFLASDSAHASPLLLDEEIRTIKEKVRASDYRDAIDWVTFGAVRTDDLLLALNMHRPTIVHFSGHGSCAGEIIVLDEFRKGKPVPTAALKDLFRIFKDSVRLVVLNCCHSEFQAAEVSEVIDCVVGMGSEIGDGAAIVFASSLYQAIGFGRSVKEAFDQGIVALMLHDIPDDDKPKLRVRFGVDPSTLVLVDSRSLGFARSQPHAVTPAQVIVIVRQMPVEATTWEQANPLSGLGEWLGTGMLDSLHSGLSHAEYVYELPPK